MKSLELRVVETQTLPINGHADFSISDLEEPTFDNLHQIEKAETLPDLSTDELLRDYHLDEVGMYLKEISAYPLLDREQEVQLGIRVRKGIQNRTELNSLTNNSLSLDEKIQMHDSVTDGRNAHAEMVKGNLRLVVAIAKKYIGRGLPFIDLVGAGNTGLLRAADEFDPYRGFKFSTYAVWWIRQSITRTLENESRLVRVPSHLHQLQTRVIAFSLRCLAENGENPSTADIQTEFELSNKQIKALKKASRFQNIMSLEAEDPETGKSESEEKLHNTSQMGTEEQVVASTLRQTIQSLLEQKGNDGQYVLEPREVTILKLRVGWDDGVALTLEEIGKRFGLSRERIRQIEEVAQEKLRRSKTFEGLREYWE